ncbi:hypothetical protein ACWDR3_41115 [Streptomyces sp. NPDC001002]
MSSAPADAAGPNPAEGAQELRRWLELYGNMRVGDPSWVYRSFAELVADCGFYQQPAPWTQRSVQKPGQCFKAAREWAERPGWTYVEGYVLVPSAAPFSCFEHAWCLTDHGVADPSLPDGVAAGYIGIPLTDAFCRQQRAARATDAVFVSDPASPLAGINESILRTGLPSDAMARSRPGPHWAVHP